MVKQRLQEELKRLKSDNLLRCLRSQQDTGSGRALIDGREAVLFAGNDYLGLATHPAVTRAAAKALVEYGASAGASRLISGNHEIYCGLEEELASFKGKEAALVFPSGYMANLGLLSALAGPSDTLFMDRLCHASLYDGWRLSGARLKRYQHNDVRHLEEQLAGEEPGGSIRLIASDGVFSMDGDLAPLPQLKRLAEDFECLLAVDDAHGTGVLGTDGKGTAAYQGVEVDVEVGTLSKAFGSLGGFVVGSRELIDYLVNRARTFIFTTGLPPATLAAAAVSLRLFREEGWRRQRLLELAACARRELAAAGFVIPEGITPIIPVITGDEETALELSRLCLQRGVFIPAVRTPAVPKGRARLRLTVSADHTDGQLAKAIDVLTVSAGELGII